MVNIHARQGISVVQHPRAGRIDVDPDLGTVNVPKDLAEEFLAIRVDGEPLWETATQFERRRAAVELERKRDPAQLALLLGKLVELQANQAGVDLNAPLDKPSEPGVPVVTVQEPDRTQVVADAAAKGDYDILTRDELVQVAGVKGLDSTGNKATLLARLRAKDGRK